MKKTGLLVIVFVAASMFAFAQKGSKVGHINSQELITAMPAAKAAQDSLELFAKSLRSQFEKMDQELQAMAQEFQEQQKTMSELVRETKLSEYADKQKRLSDFQTKANQAIAQKEQELFKPIADKAMAAIEKVAKANAYNYILDQAQGGILYQSGDDLLPLVKKELGIK